MAGIADFFEAIQGVLEREEYQQQLEIMLADESLTRRPGWLPPSFDEWQAVNELNRDFLARFPHPEGS